MSSKKQAGKNKPAPSKSASKSTPSKSTAAKTTASKPSAPKSAAAKPATSSSNKAIKAIKSSGAKAKAAQSPARPGASGVLRAGAAPNTNTTYYQVQPGYTDPNNVTSSVPFLLPPMQLKSGGPSYGKAVAVEISDVYGPQASGPNCPLGTPCDFTLAWTKDPNHTGGWLAVITIPAYAWNADSTSRQKLATQYGILCGALESLETSGCLARGGAFGAAQRVAEALPVPVTEVLYYRYGLNSGLGGISSAATPFVNLLPGMRLRVEFQGYEYTVPNSPLNGFIGTGRATYDIVEYLDPNNNTRLAFDAFLGGILPSNLTSPTAVAGGIIDLQGASTARRYYRLFYPGTFSNSASGNTSPANNVMLIGANTLADLSTATTAYLTKQTCAPGGTSVLCNLFRGRAIAIPEILVYLSGQTFGGPSGQPQAVSGQPSYVPVGTTVRNLIERRFNWIFRTYTQAGSETRLSLLRQYRQISQNAPLPTPANYNSVFLNTNLLQPPSQPGLDVYDLPLVQGDFLSFTTVS